MNRNCAHCIHCIAHVTHSILARCLREHFEDFVHVRCRECRHGGPCVLLPPPVAQPHGRNSRYNLRARAQSNPPAASGNGRVQRRVRSASASARRPRASAPPRTTRRTRSASQANVASRRPRQNRSVLTNQAREPIPRQTRSVTAARAGRYNLRNRVQNNAPAVAANPVLGNAQVQRRGRLSTASSRLQDTTSQRTRRRTNANGNLVNRPFQRNTGSASTTRTPKPTQRRTRSFTAKAIAKALKWQNRPQSMKPVACPRCGIQSSNSHNLRRHFMIHTNERRFECNHCPKRFRQKTHLQKHMRTHRNE